MGNSWEDHRLSGLKEGTALKLIDLTIKKFKKGYSAEQTAEMLEESVDTIEPIYEILASTPDDLDAGKVYELLSNASATV